MYFNISCDEVFGWFDQFQETLDLMCSTCTLHLTFRGSGINPDIDVSVQDGVLDFGYVHAGDFREQTFTVGSNVPLLMQLLMP